ncbi:carbamate kinase [Candidatus Roizmanbacteria bacterium RIFCSPHIGHO2_02_FULL_37_13b]|uniref:Carbamate kinase n=1 Tax=Candidatus Roizmanbacteria bacterium RIFCSPLOWO2_02_FULL_36_11 TaxID=1802071 RepID=A0A1F7JGN5_9BACT|nr:MAG: carbamate kinase [Candidatus Roizmanbacteria bacterium RIFCSPHIGHO2_02_FULL_37_13b]OGK54775.1 MAG: carbamate kinase [Candidatus Roizmanbacteria bacterium RIFCSPLOWO2_02_FULL_36_11]
MQKKTIVIALGGNAILQKGEEGNFETQYKNVNQAMEGIADLTLSNKYRIVITHGNGPQVGALLIQQAMSNQIVPEMPMHVCGAMSQGLIGYLIQQSLQNIFNKKKIKKEVATIITQVVVDVKSKAYINPSKPVGLYYKKNEADKIAKEKGYVFKEDAGRGYRRVVPSPYPIKIIEIEAIKKNVNEDILVIAGGGGGIPVYLKNDKIHGSDAVIDKDHLGALLADELDADEFIILTAVENAYLNFNKKNQLILKKISVKDAKKYLGAGHFAAGSMGPKIEAAINFVTSKKKRKSVITSNNKLLQALSGKAGTEIVNN